MISLQQQGLLVLRPQAAVKSDGEQTRSYGQHCGELIWHVRKFMSRFNLDKPGYIYRADAYTVQGPEKRGQF